MVYIWLFIFLFYYVCFSIQQIFHFISWQFNLFHNPLNALFKTKYPSVFNSCPLILALMRPSLLDAPTYMKQEDIPME